MVDHNHTEETQVLRRGQAKKYKLVVPLTFFYHLSHLLTGTGRKRQQISFYILSFIWCPWFLLLLNSPLFCYCSTSSYLFPLPNQSNLLIYFPGWETLLFPFLFPSQLISFCLLPGFPPVPLLCFLPSFPYFSSFYNFFFYYIGYLSFHLCSLLASQVVGSEQEWLCFQTLK